MAKERPLNILITGGTDGIGLLLAEQYQALGANIAVTGRKKHSSVIGILPDTVHYIKADQSAPEQAANTIFTKLSALGWQHCDITILNAGSGQVGHPFQETVEHLRDTLNVNLVAPILIAQSLGPLLRSAERGKLIIIGTTSHKRAEKFASYAAAKAGLHGLVRSLREEWRGQIEVQIIHLGPTATNMHVKAGFEPGWVKYLFLSPQFVARSIRAHINRNNSPVSLSFASRIIDILLFRGWRTR